jgi:FAD/FMN-containing dehydrogenase
MLTRRELLRRSAAATLTSTLFCRDDFLHAGDKEEAAGVLVNDVQSQLNATRVRRVEKPRSVDDLQKIVQRAKREDRAICVAGGRHAMGGQQFGDDMILIDTTTLNRVIRLDEKAGQVEVEGGIEWPELIDHLNRTQKDAARPWAIRQKQTGVDRVTIAGSMSANAHGRGLRFPPMISDVESFVLIDADGKAKTCSRKENAELFQLAIGGYGLFGIIAQVKLRLVPRAKVERIVKVIAVRDLLENVTQRIKDGFEFGDGQFATDVTSSDQPHQSVFSCYRPVPIDTEIKESQKQLSQEDWSKLYFLARTEKKRAFEEYSKYYLTTNGQVYWSDLHQLSGNLTHRNELLDKKLGPDYKGSEMISEVYVSQENFVPLLAAARKDVHEQKMDLIYGTIRFIAKDSECFLAWARQPFVCIVWNLHVVHTKDGLKKGQEDFRRLIGRALEFGGHYFLTYHRWATRAQVEKAYPRFVDFLRLKKKYDARERFQSNWYRHYREMFADKL